MNIAEAQATLRAELAYMHARGIRYEPGTEPLLYVSEDPERGAPFSVAMDALPTLATEASSGVPMFFTNFVDPEVYEILFAPLKVAELLGGETQRGTWTDISAMFPVAESTGETSSYEDYSNSGMSGVNMNWPQRESYLLQTIIGYGELEVARAGAARINIVAEKEKSAATNLARFVNFSYAFGVQGLQNYGTTNDPNLSASITPASKSYGGTAWISGGVVRASANEIVTDVQSIIGQLIKQGNGRIDTDTPMTMGIPSTLNNALTTINAFGITVREMLTRSYPNLKIISGIQQYGVTSAQNPQGIAAGNLVQIVAMNVEGKKTGLCGYNEKMRAHPVIREMSAFRQKKTSGTWGAIIRMPFAIASMVGA